jgi:phosphopantothenoylcysteine decarboxylase/phosphopantothenate--cysteine ligase
VLENKTILLGVTGSIAVYKSVDLARRLKQEGALVSVIMTESACRFVTPLTFESALGLPVHTDLFDGYLPHIKLVRDAHLLIVAPATANTINKIACGIADNLLTTLWLAYRGPALMAPAMNPVMYNNPILKKNIKSLKAMGTAFIGPASGDLACGDEGEGRMSEVSDIIEAAKVSLSPKDLTGHNILVTAGPTREPVDPVRFLSNRSSGKMGFAIARAARRRGARVTLVSGPTSQRPPEGMTLIPVERAVDMERAVKKSLKKTTAVIMAAAVSDFAPSPVGKMKIPKKDRLSLNISKTPDIIEGIGRSKGGRFLVGFAAETGKDIAKAKDKLKRKNLDLIVLNDISQKGAGFDTDTNIVTMINRRGEAVDYPIMKKEKIADLILDEIAGLKGSGHGR